MDAIYFDGKTAAAHQVTTAIEKGQIIIRSQASDQSIIETLPLDSFIHDTANTVQTVLLGADGRRLKFTDTKAPEWLQKHSLHTAPAFSTYSWSPRKFAALASFAVIFIVAALWSVPRLTSALIVFVPESVDEEIGKTVLKSAIDQFGGICRDRDAQAALQRVVDKLLVASNDGRRVSSFLVKSPKVNAFATPGNNLVVLTGLIKLAQTPEEFTGVIGHELGHLKRRHPMRGLLGKMGVGLFSLYLSKDSGSMGEISLQMAGALSAQSHSRSQEREADRIGMELLAGAGIDSSGLSAFFSRLAEKEKGGSFMKDFVSSHPPTKERAATVADLAKTGGPAMSGADWQALKGACAW